LSYSIQTRIIYVWNFSRSNVLDMHFWLYVVPVLFLLMFPDAPERTHHTQNGFRNPWFSEEDEKSFLDFLRWQWNRRIARQVVKPDRYDLKAIPREYVNPPNRMYSGMLTWVGHATYLIQLENKNILTDPVWSDRVGPLGRRLGPRRYMPPGIPWEKLPPIDIVVISHNHYDHMDRATLERLAQDFDPVFFVPLENAKFLREWGIENVTELDWWDAHEIDGIRIICTPTQHFSQRWINDRNESLWSSWLIQGESTTIYFAGDTGYFPGFKEIGERYAPIDVALMPIGAYEPRWFMRPVHVNPEEALRGFLDMNARYFAAMHWGTFDQSDELLDQPPKDLMAAVKSLEVDPARVWIFAFGESRAIPPRE
jgi:N-acyl-phosphatidylethanolamine-hydrolysing phospholipase D